MSRLPFVISRDLIRCPVGRVNRTMTVRLLWCMFGAAAGISLALLLVASPVSPFMLASLGGSAVFLFALTRAPAAQPCALFGGHIGGALIGICCYKYCGDALWVYALAQSLTLGFMLLTRTVRPPAGANPIIMIYVHAGFGALWNPVFVGIASLALVAFVWSRKFPGLARYPVEWGASSPPSMFWGGWVEKR